MKKNYVLVLILLLLLVGCSSTNKQQLSNNKVGTYFNFETFNTLSGKTYYPELFLGSPYHLLVVKNHLILCDKYEGKLITVIDINNPSKAGRTLSIGNGPGEILHPVDIQYNKTRNTLDIYERQSSCLKSFYINDILSVQEKNQEKRKTLFDGMGRITNCVDDQTVMSGAKNKLFYLYNNAGSIITEFGEHEKSMEVTKDKESIFLLTQSLLSSSPNGEHIVSAGEFSDQLLFYTINKSDIILAKSYFSIKTSLITKTENVDDRITHSTQLTPESLYTYKDICPTEKFVYLLYWGIPRKDLKNATQCYVIVLNWNGEFHKGYRISELLRSIGVDEVNNHLYAVTADVNSNSKLMKYEL